MTVPASSSDGIVVDKMRFAFTGGPFELRIGSMEIRAGEHVAIVGPSGCGKTTLLELIAGILVPDAGRVSADGCDWETLDEASRRRRRIERVGLVFQEFELLPHLSVLENIVLPMHLVPSLARGGETLELGRELARRLRTLPSPTPVLLRVEVEGRPAGTWPLPAGEGGSWVEAGFRIPERLIDSGEITITLSGRFLAHHLWVLQ